MSYRNLTVKGTKYRFVIGEKFTKVQKEGKNFAIYENSKIGHKLAYRDQYVVKPKDVTNAILGKPVEEMTCRHGTVSIELAYDPFESEIYQKGRLVINCDECLKELAADI